MAQDGILDTDIAHRYPSGERPRRPPMEHEQFDPPTDIWVNFWDLHPIDHGGTFVRFDGDAEEWEIIEVTPPDLYKGGGYFVNRLTVHPSDVWEDRSDPMTDFSDEMRRIVRQFPSPPALPADLPFIEDVTYYVADFTSRTRGRHDMEELPGDDDRVAEYWEMLEGYGIGPGAVVGVLDEQLPPEHRDDD